MRHRAIAAMQLDEARSAQRVLGEHVAALPPGPMSESADLFPSTTGGMRSGSALEKPVKPATSTPRSPAVTLS